MDSLRNLDLLSVGVAIAAIGILGFIIFFSNRRSITNRTFLLFSIVTVFWGAINYSSYQINISTQTAFWFLKLTIFFAVWQAFSLFQLFFVFPYEKVKFSRGYKSILIPVVILTSILTLTPFVFSEIAKISPEGKILEVENGPGIAVFGMVSVGLVIGAAIVLFRKIRNTQKTERKPFFTILLGTLITFSLIIVFNFLLPSFTSNPRFIPLGAVFVFPFITFTYYAISKHHLLNIKVVTTEIIAFILTIVSLFEVILSKDPLTIIFRFGIFSLILAFCILLIRSVIKEVEQREELAKINIELRKAKLELESLSRFKSQMLSLAAHQIKAPLAAIKGFASILMEGLYGPVSEKVKGTIGKMKDSADELIDLINTLLDLRKVEEGKMEYKFETVKLKDLVQNVFDGLKIQADAKKLEYSLASTSEANVSADPQKLKQVLANLVENSIKYTNSGFVKVESRDDPSTDSTSSRQAGAGQGGYVIFSVSDSGLGIGPNLSPHLFDQEFVRDERVKREIKGTGLGLYIAKNIITSHSGTIWAESPGEGKGSTFYVKLRKI